MMYKVYFTDDALKGVALLRKSSPLGYKKLKKLFDELVDHPRTGTGHPERLKYVSGDIWSRHIDKKNRLMYIIHDDIIEVLVVSVISHYGDK